MRNGILVGGNWIVDQVKLIDVFPEEEKLVNIFSESSCNGGSAYNVITDLAKLQANFPLSGVGLVGDDERGDQIIQHCQSVGINTEQIRKTKESYTSYTDVMSVKETGRRTFFINVAQTPYLISPISIFQYPGIRYFTWATYYYLISWMLLRMMALPVHQRC
ncbi:carbohydrate kinase family protein [Mucilaginibacter antarcticus]|uniref:carbohydrate kinase family protein n=1 Tax=Mucilaginibacter antarcticus TaxID=1855725 RepID=UPI003633263D